MAKIKPTRGYVTKPGQLSVPPDVAGATSGFRPGYGYYVKVPGQPYPARRIPQPVVKKKPAAAVGSGGSGDFLSTLIGKQLATLQGGPAMGKTAAQAAADQMKLELDAYRASFADQKSELERRADRSQGFALALSQANQTDPAQIADLYRGAADRLRGYGTGLTGDVAAAQQATTDQANQQIQTVLGPNAGPSGGGYSIEGIRNAAQMAGVVIPGSSLESRAVDAATQALYNNKATSATVGDIAQGYLQQEGDLDKQIKARAVELSGQLPALYRQQLQDIQTAQTQKLATLISALALGNTVTNTQSEAAYRKALAAAARNKAKAGKTPTFDATRSRALGYQVDQFGNPIRDAKGGLIPLPTYRINAAGTAAVKIPTGKKGSGTATHMQQKTTPDGRIYNFDPATGNSYLPGDSKNPVDPNTLQGKISAADRHTFMAKAATGVGDGIKKKLGPSQIYKLLVAQGVPGWIALQALRAEAANHAGNPGWDAVTNPGWVAGTQGK